MTDRSYPATVAVRREWLEHVIKTMQGDLPSGRIGDVVFLLRDQLQDILDRSSPPEEGELLTVETMREAVQSAVDAVAFPISRRSAGTEDAADFDTYWRGMYYDLLNRSRADWMAAGAAAQSGRNDALRLLADLFTEAEHETWRKEEIVNIIEDAIRLGSPQSSQHHNTAQGE